MRVILKFKPLTSHSYESVGAYDVQGFIYNLLRGTYFHKHHLHRGFKFFTFSNIFPITPYSLDHEKTLIISSPNANLAWHIYEQLKYRSIFNLNKYPMQIVSVRKSFQKPRRNIITATPIVLYEDNTNNRYFSFKKDEFGFFFKRLEDNALKKYNAYYQEDLVLQEPLVTDFKFKKEVPVNIKLHGETILIIGSMWKLKWNISDDMRKLTHFLFDTGLGEKNSLGMGFINNYQRK